MLVRRTPGAGACRLPSALVVAETGPVGPVAVPFRRPSVPATMTGSGVAAVPTRVTIPAVPSAAAIEVVHAAVAPSDAAATDGRRLVGAVGAPASLHLEKIFSVNTDSLNKNCSSGPRGSSRHNCAIGCGSSTASRGSQRCSKSCSSSREAGNGCCHKGSGSFNSTS